MKSERWIVCECGSLEHFIVLSYETEGGFDDTVYVTIHLSNLPFWQRLKLGVLYILGRKSRYGNFEEVLLDKTKLKEVIDTLSGFHTYMMRTEQNINF